MLLRFPSKETNCIWEILKAKMEPRTILADKTFLSISPMILALKSHTAPGPGQTTRKDTHKSGGNEN